MTSGIGFDRAIDAWCAACAAGDHAAMMATLAPGFVLRSPITERVRFEGIDQADELFSKLFPLIQDLRLLDRVGSGCARQVLLWRGRVGDYPVEEANVVTVSAQGLIAEMAVFMRPLPGLLQFASKLAPEMARRRGRLRALAARVPLKAVAALYCSGEAPVIALAGAGTRQPTA